VQPYRPFDATLAGDAGDDIDPADVQRAVAMAVEMMEHLPQVQGQVLTVPPTRPGMTPEEAVTAWLASSTGPLVVTPVPAQDVRPGQVVVSFPEGLARDASSLLGRAAAVLPRDGLAVTVTVPEWPIPGTVLVAVMAEP